MAYWGQYYPLKAPTKNRMLALDLTLRIFTTLKAIWILICVDLLFLIFRFVFRVFFLNSCIYHQFFSKEMPKSYRITVSWFSGTWTTFITHYIKEKYHLSHKKPHCSVMIFRNINKPKFVFVFFHNKITS